MHRSVFRTRVAVVTLAFGLPGLVATAVPWSATASQPSAATAAPAVASDEGPTLVRDADEVPDVVEIVVPGTKELDRLVATGVDLDHGVHQEADGLAVRAIVTPGEVAQLERMGFTVGETLYTAKDSEAALAERDRSIAQQRQANRTFAQQAETNPDVSDIKIIRADYYTSYGVPVLSVEAKYADGQTVTTPLTVERDSGPGTAFGSGGTQTITRFVDAGVYMYHRGASPTTGASAVTTRPDRIRIISPGGDEAIVKVKDWLPTGDEADPFKGDGYQQDFVYRYMDPTDLYTRIKLLARQFPDISEIVELPHQTNGYQRRSQALIGMVGTNGDAAVGVDSVAWGHQGGNRTRLAVVRPSTPDAPLTVGVGTTGTGTTAITTVTVTSATDATGAATSTAAQVVAAINGDSAASAVMSAYTYRGNAGAGVVPATAATTLTDGLNAPSTIARGPSKVYALKIGKVRDGSKPGVFFYAQEHAREWVPPLVTIETAERLLRNYSSHAGTRDLVDNLEIWILPSVNPDGGHYSFYDFASQRKNMVNYCPAGSTNDYNSRNSWGVDVNRNYTEYSVYDGFSGASATSCTSGTYAGPGELTEPEAKNVDWVAARPNMKWSMNVHSSGNYFMWSPGAYKDGTRETAPYPTLDEEQLFWGASSRILTSIKRYRGLSVTPARTGPVIDVLYSAAGNSGDMLWYKYGIYAWDFEVGSTFQPPFLADDPNAAQAHSETMEFANGLIEMARIARDHDTDTVPPTSKVVVSESAQAGKVAVQFETNEPAAVFYTTDGSVPDLESTRYEAEGVREGGKRVLVDSGTEIRWLAVDSKGNVERHFVPGEPGNFRTWIAEIGWEAPLEGSATTVTLDRTTVTVGKAGATAAIVVKGTGAGTPPVASGVVDVLVDGARVGSAELGDDGTAAIALPAIATAGATSVTAAYGGDADLAPSSSAPTTLTVSALPASTTAVSLDRASVGIGESGVNADVTVGGTGAAGSSVDVLVDGVKAATATLAANGKASVALPAFSSAGTKQVTAVFAGNGDLAGSSSAAATLRVAKAGSTVKARAGKVKVGKRAKVTVRVRSSGPLTGKVEIRRGKKVIGTGRVDAAGKVTIRLKKIARPGKVKLKIRYLGSADVAASSAKVRLTVTRR
ncbi:M14 family zinc carboxypeptidase [Nocardioides hwasunensis]|uniref:Ig-like domain repeat protein n=1 Tax=Nocardioides hwasunensis TaxID=397258 RepID=A0ABR8MJT2_9ACTN|nr:M14 family zinc carboxypeptidase [Nocardioides hwasunensis]MBD3915015.1 Ig-like domain repeat protein [Nocardioides hwasunensis]